MKKTIAVAGPGASSSVPGDFNARWSTESRLEALATPLILRSLDHSLVEKWQIFSPNVRMLVLSNVANFVDRNINFPGLIARRERAEIILTALKKQLKALRAAHKATLAFANTEAGVLRKLGDRLHMAPFLKQLEGQIEYLEQELALAKVRYGERRFGTAGYVYWLVEAQQLTGRQMDPNGKILTLDAAELSTLIEVVRDIRQPGKFHEVRDPRSLQMMIHRFLEHPANRTFVSLIS